MAKRMVVEVKPGMFLTGKDLAVFFAKLFILGAAVAWFLSWIFDWSVSP